MIGLKKKDDKKDADISLRVMMRCKSEGGGKGGRVMRNCWGYAINTHQLDDFML